jgi:hypothetical protein
MAKKAKKKASKKASKKVASKPVAKAAKKATKKPAKKAGKRTTHRSSKGTKLYAVRSGDGKFKDIQTFKRAHGADIKRGSKAEAAAEAQEDGN